MNKDALIAICGERYVLTESEATAPYLTDWRGHYTGKALAVVLPGSTEEVSAIIALANEQSIPIVPQGGNTGMCGGATPDTSGKSILLSLKRMDKIRAFDEASPSITVEAGCILENIQNAASEKGLLFPLNFGSKGTCQIGGNLSTNAGGLNVLRYGNARALCLGIEAVLPNGEIMQRLSPLVKDNTGYALKDLLIGAEGTLGVITAATLKLFPKPIASATAFVGLKDIEAGITLLHSCQRMSNVIGFELIHKDVVNNVLEHFPDNQEPLKTLPDFSALVEIVSANKETMERILADAFDEGLLTDATIANSEAQRNALWAIRELVPESEILAGEAYKSDISVPINHIPEFCARAKEQALKILPNLRIFVFGHLGDGNLHYNFVIPKENYDGDFASLYPRFDDILLGLLNEYGGSISAEHGIGQKKRHLLTSNKDQAALAAMRAIKKALDPKGIMNPGKIF